MKKRSVFIAKRHHTSVSMEPEFWDEFMKIVEREHTHINKLMTKIDAEKTVKSLSSAVRIYILKYLKSNR